MSFHVDRHGMISLSQHIGGSSGRDEFHFFSSSVLLSRSLCPRLGNVGNTGEEYFGLLCYPVPVLPFSDPGIRRDELLHQSQ